MTLEPRSHTGLPALAPGSVLLLRGTLDPGPELSALLDTVLTPGERERAAGLRIPAVNRRFRATRGWTRIVLAAYADVPPGQLAFTTGPTGKPALVGGPSFNISHTGEHFLLALASDGALGVDAEEGRQLRDLEGLAKRVFTPRECAELLGVPAGKARELAFLRGWTRKEALAKAMGRGLSLPLQRISVEILRSEGSLLRAIDPSLSDGSNPNPAGWSVVDADRAAPEAGAAAVAWDRPITSVRVLELPMDPDAAVWIRGLPR